MTTNGFNKYLDEQNEKHKQGTSGFNNYLNAHIERNSNAEDDPIASSIVEETDDFNEIIEDETDSETNVPVIEDHVDL